MKEKKPAITWYLLLQVWGNDCTISERLHDNNTLKHHTERVHANGTLKHHTIKLKVVTVSSSRSHSHSMRKSCSRNKLMVRTHWTHLPAHPAEQLLFWPPSPDSLFTCSVPVIIDWDKVKLICFMLLYWVPCDLYAQLTNHDALKYPLVETEIAQDYPR